MLTTQGWEASLTPRIISIVYRENGTLPRSRHTGRTILSHHCGTEEREVLELSHPSLVMQGEDLVESVAIRDFKAGRDNGYLKLLPVKNSREYIFPQ